ncbi:unnamed protein product [Tilletia caries]|uniref:Zn(2)-C6 fungal-type domain-containing protein n=1 Tax=Tilletia caries TaxID=13290 RepID=A0ABN7IMY8_9BASI|nr:hypothetical protein CF336_g1326 [Tilletia laevis]KAE8208250.1 hypothetical protein CF335_g563 [Tilletia laevis]CAD6891653.1 unnamed protein product [Tilletia caries]CAD6912636.1 unnamed protein product [Tilletia caries]
MSPSTPASSTSAGPRLTTVPINVRAACEMCRTRKLKCSGAPIDAAMQAANIAAGGPDAVLKCARCAKEGIECHFATRAPIGRPKKRKSDDGSDWPMTPRDNDAASSSAATADPSASTASSKPRQPKGPARKRTKKDTLLPPPPAQPLDNNEQAYLPSNPEQDQLVAHAAAAAAAAIAMGASTAAYVDANGDPIPSSALTGFTDVSSPAAAASTLLDFRYQQQSNHQTSMPSYSGSRYQPAPPGPPPPFANLGSSDAGPQSYSEEQQQQDDHDVYTNAPNMVPGTDPDLTSDDHHHQQENLRPAGINGDSTDHSQNENQPDLQANHTHGTPHPGPGSPDNAQDRQDFRGRPQQGLHRIPNPSSDFKQGGNNDSGNGNGSRDHPWQMDPQLQQQDFQMRPQHGIHRIPRAPDFDPGPSSSYPSSSSSASSHFIQPPPSRYHPHYLPPPPSDRGTPTTVLHSLPSHQLPSGIARPSNLPGAMYDHSMTNSPSYSSLGLQTPATEMSSLPGSSALGSGPSLNSLSLAAFLSSLDTLSLTASDGLTPAMLDSSSLGGNAGGYHHLQSADMSLSSSSATARPDHGAAAAVMSGQYPNQGFVLGSALFTDVSQNSFLASVPPGGHAVSAMGPVSQSGSGPLPTSVGSAASSLSSQQQQQQLASVLPGSLVDVGAPQPMAVTATTEELAGLSYALPADFNWWDDFFSKGPLLAGAGTAGARLGGAVTPPTATATTAAAQESPEDGVRGVEVSGSGLSLVVERTEGEKEKETVQPLPTAGKKKKDCCQTKASPSSLSIPAAEEGKLPTAGSCCGTAEPKTPLLGTFAPADEQRQASSSPLLERTERSGTVHCVPDPKGEGCTCLCNAEVALLSVRRVLKRTEAIPLVDDLGDDVGSKRRGTATAAAVATTLHLTLSASQAVSAQCACSADCPTCRADGGMMTSPNTSTNKRATRQGSASASSDPGNGAAPSPRIVSASLLVSTALQIYTRAVKMLRETLSSAAPPALLEADARHEAEREEDAGGDAGGDGTGTPGSELVLSRTKKAGGASGPAGDGAVVTAAPTPEAWSCTHPGHSLSLVAADRARLERTRSSSGSSSRASTSVDGAGASAAVVAGVGTLVPPESPPTSCCSTSIASTGAQASGSGSASSSHTHGTPKGKATATATATATAVPTPPEELDIDIKIGTTYRPLPHNARRIALFAMKLELRDLQEALRKVAVLAQADGVVVGWAEERESGAGGGGGVVAATTPTPTLNPIDRMVITKLHVQLGELLNTVESLGQW